MHLSFTDVHRHIADIKDNLVHVINTISKAILTARDDEKLPVYSIKSRVKSTESAYLKTKRGSFTSLDQIIDYAGMRILCLFERDIYTVNQFLLKYFKANNITIEKIKVFNYDNNAFNKIKACVESVGLGGSLVPKIDKESGYKSVHYQVSATLINKNIVVEIQLRTLLQDVWGELEHSLSYKRGGIHPHIKKSFELLSHDLQTTDALMEHLKDINEKEESGERYSNDKSGPRDYFDYEDDLIPPIFETDHKQEFDDYRNFMKGVNFKSKADYLENVKKGRELYAIVVSKLKLQDLDDMNVKYWHDMENAFLFFCEAKYREALETYTKLLSTHGNMYCLHFRIGEIYLKLGEVERALTEFDESEILISKCSNPNIKNQYDIKVVLALVYWMLGDEYIDIALKEITEAEKIYTDNIQYLDGIINKSALTNNLSWYFLSKFVITKSEDDFMKASEKFVELDKLIKEDAGDLSCNSLDTAAWFYYNRYLHKEDVNDAKQSIDCCLKMKDRFNYTSFNFSSFHVQFNHIKDIMILTQDARIVGSA